MQWTIIEVPINIFLDLSKAFDTINHTILINELRYCGMDGTALLLFENYLNNRKQYVEIEEMQSEILPIEIEVPQGSNLGPLLFIIYINYLPQVGKIFSFIIYTDDRTLSCTLKHFSDSAQNKSIESLKKLMNSLKLLNG